MAHRELINIVGQFYCTAAPCTPGNTGLDILHIDVCPAAARNGDLIQAGCDQQRSVKMVGPNPKTKFVNCPRLSALIASRILSGQVELIAFINLLSSGGSNDKAA